MSETFQSRIQIKFHEADPAGIMYFANIFSLAHDTFELFIQKAGYTWAEWFKQTEYIIPIRHAECDYLRPFKAGDVYDVQAMVSEFSTSSFKMK
jgi:acyl-CoA thioesterase FadM